MASMNTRSNLCNQVKADVEIVDLARDLGYTPVKISRNFFSLREHDSIRISIPEKLWFQNSMERGGSVIDFEMAFGNRTYREGYDEKGKLRVAGYWAARAISERFGTSYRYNDYSQSKPRSIPKAKSQPKSTSNVKLDMNGLKQLEYLPDKNKLAFDYLTVKRGINPQIVSEFIQKGIVRVGIDRQVPTAGQVLKCVFYSPENDFGIMRVMDDSQIPHQYRVMDLQGSDQDSGFFIDIDPSNDKNKTLVVTESVIDAMSVMTELQRKGEDLSDYKFLATAGTGKASRMVDYQFRRRLERKDYTGKLELGDFANRNISRIMLAFDNDEAGRKALEEVKKVIHENIESQYRFNGEVIDYLPPSGKDWNEFIQLPIEERDAAYNRDRTDESLHGANFLSESDLPQEEEIDETKAYEAISEAVYSDIGYTDELDNDSTKALLETIRQSDIDNFQKEVRTAYIEDRISQSDYDYSELPEDTIEKEPELEIESEINSGIIEEESSEKSEEESIFSQGVIEVSGDNREYEYYLLRSHLTPADVSDAIIQSSYNRSVLHGLVVGDPITKNDYDSFVDSKNAAYIVKAEFNGDIPNTVSFYSITEINNGNGGLGKDERIGGVSAVTTYRNAYRTKSGHKQPLDNIYLGDTILYNNHQMEVREIEDDYISLYDKELPTVVDSEIADRLIDVDITEKSRFVVISRGVKFYTTFREEYDSLVEDWKDRESSFYRAVAEAHPEIEMPQYKDGKGKEFERALRTYYNALRNANTDPNLVYPERDFGSPPKKPQGYGYNGKDKVGYVRIEDFFSTSEYLLDDKITPDDVIKIFERNGGDYNAISTALSLIGSKALEEDYGNLVDNKDNLTYDLQVSFIDNKYNLKMYESGVRTSSVKEKSLSFDFTGNFLSARNLTQHDIIYYNNARQEVISISDDNITLIDLDSEDRGEAIVTSIEGEGWYYEIDGNGFSIIEKGSERDPEKIVNRTPVIKEEDVSDKLNITNNGFMIRDGVLEEYYGDETTVVIPDGVTEIGTGAFANSNVVHVVIPDGVKKIGTGGFSGSTVEHVDIPNSVTTIGMGAFEECRYLRDLSIPRSVTSIEDAAFRRSGLRSIIIPDSVKEIGGAAFADSHYLSSVTIDSRLSAIPDDMFLSCSRLQDVSIPDSVKSIGNHAFAHTGLIEIEIPSSVKSIGRYAFYSSDIENISITNEKVKIGKNAFKDTELEDSIQERFSDSKDDVDKSRPYIRCEWSESYFFEDNTNYSISTFDSLMAHANSLHIAERDAAIAKYGSLDNAFEAWGSGDYDGRGIGYDKTKFTVVYPNGETYTTRQDIGDALGGVLEFLESEHHDITRLKEDIELHEEHKSIDSDSYEHESVSDTNSPKQTILFTEKELQSFKEEAEAVISDLQDSKGDVFVTKLDSGLRSLVNEDTYKAFLTAQVKAPYNNIGFDNQLRVFATRPDATYVMGYNQWQEAGRQVNRGSKGIPIVSPSFLARREDKLSKADSIISALKKQAQNGNSTPKTQWGKLELSLNISTGEISTTLKGKPYMTFQTANDFRNFVEKRVNASIDKSEKIFVFDISDTSKSKNTKDMVVRQIHEIPKIDNDKAQRLSDVLSAVAANRGLSLDNLSMGDNTVQNCKAIISEFARQYYDMDNSAIDITDLTLDNRIAVAQTAIKADTMAYCLGQRFGVDVDTPSFQYVSSFAHNFDAATFKVVIETALKETMTVTNELSATLADKGLNLDLSPKESTLLDKDTIQSLSADYLRNAMSVREHAQSSIDSLPALVAQFSSVPEVKNLMSKQYNSFKNELSCVNATYDGIEALNNATTRQEQDTALQALSSAKAQMSALQSTDKEYVVTFLAITESLKARRKVNWEKDPLSVLKDLAKSYPKLAELSNIQQKYIAGSEYINKSYSRYLAKNPETFIKNVTNRATVLNKISSRNGVFVEIQRCENLYTATPYLKAGTLCSPAVANKVITECEKESQKVIAMAEKEGFILPPARCDYSVFVPNGNNLEVFKCSLDIGDGTQKSLQDNIKQWCENTELQAKVSDAFSERASSEQIFEPSLGNSSTRNVSDAKSELSNTQYDNRSLDEMEHEARKGSQAKKEENAKQGLGKNSQSRTTANARSH